MVLKVDEFTKAKVKGRFARVCVEVDLTVPLKSGVRIGSASSSFFQRITYENLPSLCFSCGKVVPGPLPFPSLGRVFVFMILEVVVGSALGKRSETGTVPPFKNGLPFMLGQLLSLSSLITIPRVR